MMIQEPQDIRGGPAPRRSAHGRDSFGPQGAELIRELRRIEGLLGRDASGFRANRKPAAGQRAAETTAAATQAHQEWVAPASLLPIQSPISSSCRWAGLDARSAGQMTRSRLEPVAASAHSAAPEDARTARPHALTDSLTRCGKVLPPADAGGLRLPDRRHAGRRRSRHQIRGWSRSLRPSSARLRSRASDRHAGAGPGRRPRRRLGGRSAALGRRDGRGHAGGRDRREEDSASGRRRGCPNPRL